MVQKNRASKAPHAAPLGVRWRLKMAHSWSVMTESVLNSLAVVWIDTMWCVFFTLCCTDLRMLLFVCVSCGVKRPRGTLKLLSRCLISMVMERWTWRSLNRLAALLAYSCHAETCTEFGKPTSLDCPLISTVAPDCIKVTSNTQWQPIKVGPCIDIYPCDIVSEGKDNCCTVVYDILLTLLLYHKGFLIYSSTCTVLLW